MRLREFKSVNRVSLNEFGPAILAVPIGIDMAVATWGLIAGALGIGAIQWAQENPAAVNRIGRDIEGMFTPNEIASNAPEINTIITQTAPPAFVTPKIKADTITTPKTTDTAPSISAAPTMPTPTATDTSPKVSGSNAPPAVASTQAPSLPNASAGATTGSITIPDVSKGPAVGARTAPIAGAIPLPDVLPNVKPDATAISGAPPTIGIDTKAPDFAKPTDGAIAKPGEVTIPDIDAGVNSGAQAIPKTIPKATTNTDVQAIPKAVTANPTAPRPAPPPPPPIPVPYKGTSMPSTGDYIYTGSKTGPAKGVLNLKNQPVNQPTSILNKINDPYYKIKK